MLKKYKINKKIILNSVKGIIAETSGFASTSGAPIVPMGNSFTIKEKYKIKD